MKETYNFIVVDISDSSELFPVGIIIGIDWDISGINYFKSLLNSAINDYVNPRDPKELKYDDSSLKDSIDYTRECFIEVINGEDKYELQVISAEVYPS